MWYHKCATQAKSFSVFVKAFLQGKGLPFSEVLSEEQIKRAFEAEDALFGEGEDAVYTTPLVLLAFLSQVMHSGPERSCDAAVGRLRTLCVYLSIHGPSPDTGAYCRARAKLSEAAMKRLSYEVADQLEAAVPKKWLWFGRHVKIVDGSTLQTPDTADNQAEWPQPSTQQVGLGFPLMRICALMSLATGACCSLMNW